jgi:glycosyltransferase involved in cell wall biosynthesis
VSILFVHERASFTGGVEQNISDTVQALRARGIVCHLAYNPQIPTQQSFFDLFDSSHSCNELGTTASILSTPTLGAIAMKTEADCAYIHKLPTVPNSILSVQVRTVQMVHDHDLCCPRKHKYYAHNRKVCTNPLGFRCYLDGAFLARDYRSPFGFRYESIRAKRQEMKRRCQLDLSLVASEFMRQELIINGFNSDRVAVLPLAVRRSVVPTTEIPSGAPTILYVGQLIRGKGVDLLLRALAMLRVPFRALIIGKGNAEAELHALSRELGLDHRLEFVGWVNNEDLHRYYALSDIVAVPSRWPEPFGMVGLEAMRHSKPVVAFEVGGIPDWLRHEKTGLLAPAADVQAYAAALRRLLTDKKLAARFGAAGATQIKMHFDFTTYIDRLQQALLPFDTCSENIEEMEYAS